MHKQYLIPGTRMQMVRQSCSSSVSYKLICLLDDTYVKRLLELLDGLPLAITQAGAYLQQTGMGIKSYLRIYEEQREGVVEILDNSSIQLDDYVNRSIWTTWTISYNAVLQINEHAAHLLLLWSYCNRNDFWHGMLLEALVRPSTARALTGWIGDIAQHESSFREAMRLLRGYSLIEGAGDAEGYTMHGVVHHWSYLYSDMQNQSEPRLLAFAVIAKSIPDFEQPNSFEQQQRILPHAQTCFERTFRAEYNDVQSTNNFVYTPETDSLLDIQDILGAFTWFGVLYQDLGKFMQAEKMYTIALQGAKMELRAEHKLTLDILHVLGNLYSMQDRLQEAEEMYLLALQGYEGASSMETATLEGNLALLYRDQGFVHADQSKTEDAEKILLRVLQQQKQTIGAKHLSTLRTVSALGAVYFDQNKLEEAEKMYSRASQDFEEALGPNHVLSLESVTDLGALYNEQGRYKEAEETLLRALRGFETTLGPTNMHQITAALYTMMCLGNLCSRKDKLDEARILYERALAGYRITKGDSSRTVRHLEQYLEQLNLSTKSNQMGK